MTRSLWKGIFFSNELLKLKKNKYKFKNRSTVFVNGMKNKLLHIHNGKAFIPIRCNKEGMVGHKLGEFSFTTKKCHKTKKDKKNFKLKK